MDGPEFERREYAFLLMLAPVLPACYGATLAQGFHHNETLGFIGGWLVGVVLGTLHLIRRGRL